jgi:hypothetical protein
MLGIVLANLWLRRSEVVASSGVADGRSRVLAVDQRDDDTRSMLSVGVAPMQREWSRCVCSRPAERKLSRC